MFLETLLRNFTQGSLDNHPINHLKCSSFHGQHRKSTLKQGFLKDPLVIFAENESHDLHMQRVTETFRSTNITRKIHLLSNNIQRTL